MRVTRRRSSAALRGGGAAAGLEAEFPRAELVVLDGCGHVPMADCPEAFDRVFVPFLAAAP